MAAAPVVQAFLTDVAVLLLVPAKVAGRWCPLLLKAAVRMPRLRP